MEEIVEFFLARWAEFWGWDWGDKLGVVLGIIAVLGMVWRALTYPARASKRRKAAEADAQAEQARLKTQADLEQLAKYSATQTALLEKLTARMEAESADAETMATAQKTFETVLEDGDATEREALALLADGKTEAAAARYESDIQQSTAQVIDKLRRKGALFAPFDTYTAKDAYERLLAIDPDDLSARNELGHLLRRLGELDAARVAYQAILDRSENDKEGQAVALGNLGAIVQVRGDLDGAESYYKQSLAINEELGRKEGMANQLGNLGLIAQVRGDLDGAEAYLKQSLAINEELGRKEGMANQLGNLGLIARARGDLDGAEAYHKQSLAIDEELGRKEGMANQLGNLGLIARVRGDLDEAEAYYKQSLELSDALGRKQGMAMQLGNLGLIARARGDLDEAEAYHKQSLAIDEELGRKEGMASQLGNLAVVAEQRGDFVGALEHGRRAYQIFESMGALNSQNGQISQRHLARLKAKLAESKD